MKKYIIALVMLIAILLVASVSASASGGDKVDICHATGSHSNPYVEAKASKTGDAGGHDGHNGGIYPADPWGDIIPPFMYYDRGWKMYPGKNWTAEGQAILRNDCEVKVPDPEVSFRQYCDENDISHLVINFTEGIPADALKVEGQGRTLIYREGGTFDEKVRPGIYTFTFYRGAEEWGEGGEIEVETCYTVCDETFRLPNEVEYSDWSDWVWDASRDLYVRTRIKTVIRTWVDFYDRDHICKQTRKDYIQEQTRGPDEAIVDVGLKCGFEEEDVVYQLQGHIDISPDGGATVIFDDVEYTESGPIWAGFGKREWSAVANAGFVLIGDSEGFFMILEEDCNEVPPEHPPTGAGPEMALPIAMGAGGLVLMAVGARKLLRKRG